MGWQTLTYIGGHDVQVFGFSLPRPTFLPGLRGRGNGRNNSPGPVEERARSRGLERPGRRVRRLDGQGGRHRGRHGPLL